MKIQSIYDFLVEKFPLENASNFDNQKVGLQFGSITEDVETVLIALDATEQVINEAIGLGAKLIIAHHPFLFEPLLKLDYETPLGRKLSKLLSKGISVIALHTNFDVGKEGMNDLLATKLGFERVQMTSNEVCKDSFLRFGDIEPVSLKDYAYQVKEIFGEKMIRVVGRLDQTIKRVGIAGGAASSEINIAKQFGCDVLITGEIKHHQAIDAIELNFALIEVSHSIESIFSDQIKALLKDAFPALHVKVASVNPNPFQIL